MHRPATTADESAHWPLPHSRPLERHAIYFASDGQIIVDKTKRYKWEKGEWETEDSFLKI